MIKPAVLGVGYWGPKFVRSVNGLPDVHLAGNYDLSSIALEHIREKYLEIPLFTDFKQVMKKDQPGFILISPPSLTHFPIVKEIFYNNLQGLIEKSLAIIHRQLRELTKVADDSNLPLVDRHTFLHSNYEREVSKCIEAWKMAMNGYVILKHQKQILKIKTEAYYD